MPEREIRGKKVDLSPEQDIIFGELVEKAGDFVSPKEILRKLLDLHPKNTSFKHVTILTQVRKIQAIAEAAGLSETNLFTYEHNNPSRPKQVTGIRLNIAE